jgi:hypothetical protein
MRIPAFTMALLLSSTLSVGAALAWDGPALWFDSPVGALPGGGGIIGTGSARDFNITCAHCHTGAEGKIDAKLDFMPPLPSVGGQQTYEPGQTYAVSVSLLGEHLGAYCEQYMMHVNNVAVTVEDAGGKGAGVLTSDGGESSSSCPKTLPDPVKGSTVLYGDCHAIVSNGMENMTEWSFSWTAPSAGAGPLTLYYGIVDGDCDMSSRGDDVKVGTIKLGEATAAVTPGGPGNSPGGRSALAAGTSAPSLPYALGLVPIAGLALALARSARRGRLARIARRRR